MCDLEWVDCEEETIVFDENEEGNKSNLEADIKVE